MIRMTFLENARNNSYITQENKLKFHAGPLAARHPKAAQKSRSIKSAG
jgi:hypothetical protein